MHRAADKIRRLYALFFLACLLFNYPILSLFNLKRFVFGIPLLYAYVFFVWLAVIIMIAWVSKESKDESSQTGPSIFPSNLP